MIQWGEGAFDAHCELLSELAWLEKEYPEKVRLIGLARSHVNMIKMAGSCESVNGLKQVFRSN